ncbi:MAG: hypothetical protein CME70_03150 [Halobacteriovorax sp.]|nr:hypothetical protein [Halobacteriovorax sp.]MBK22980.1 hypothetical protein [Halobacteriovorax sp.]|tara:strand:- start:14476 stop:14832 length:357 start_codon:yes stop_codon:yes gene_type:complete
MKYLILLFIFTSPTFGISFSKKNLRDCKPDKYRKVKEMIDKKMGKHFIIAPAVCTYVTPAGIYKKQIEILLETNLMCQKTNYNPKDLGKCLDEKITTSDTTIDIEELKRSRSQKAKDK